MKSAHDSVNSPDLLKKDPESLEFFILKDEKVVVCRDRKEVPYWKNRSTYLSSGRLSPKFKKVVFWPGPVNPSRAMELLKEQNYVDDHFTFAVGDAAVKSPKATLKEKDEFGKLDSIRKREVERMIDSGMKIQKNAKDNSKKAKPSA